MTEPSSPGDGRPVVLDALPEQCLTMAQIDALGDGDAFDVVAPLVVDSPTDRITHVDFVRDDTHYFVGWDPETEQWERILVVVDEDDELVLESAISVVDDETGESTLETGLDANPDIEDVVAFVWAYVDYTYPETERLYNVMDDALDELRDD